MAQIFTWLMCMACLVAGGMMLAQGLSTYTVGQGVARRFRQYISPSLGAPWLVAQSRSLLEAIGRKLADSRSLHALQDELLKAGFISVSAPFVFVAARLFASLAAAGLALISAYLKHDVIESKDAAMAFFLGFFVYRGFSMFLKARGEKRQREIRREFPYVLDLLLMVLDSGVSVDQALQHVSQQTARVAPISANELARYIADVEDGMPYDKALDRLAQRLAIHEGRDFAGLLKQNLFQGGELAQPLHRLAADIAEARLAYAREQMGKKSVLLTLIMLAFFMPVLLLAVAGPAVSDVLGTLGHVAQDLQNSRTRR